MLGDTPSPSAERSALRIAIISPYSLSIPGGVQGQVMGLARALRTLGYETRVLGPCDGPPPATFVSPLGDSLPTAINGSMAPIAPDPAAQFRTIRLLADERFDVLHLHEPLAPGATQTALIMHPAPIVATFHAAGRSAPYEFLSTPLRTLTERIDRRVVVSKDARELIQRAMGGEYEVLYNGVEIETFRDAPAAAVEGRTIFFCGRHEDRKGLDVLLRAFVDLPHDDVRLVIAGVGPQTKALRAQYATNQRIEWLGQISDTDKVAQLRAASVFCAPSLRGESFGVVLIEAMAAGTPVVASALDGYQNVATHDRDSLLFPPGDAATLTRAMAMILDDDALAQRLRAAGERRAEDFSMSSLARSYAEIYEELALAQRARDARPRPRVSRSRAWAGRMMDLVRRG